MDAVSEAIQSGSHKNIELGVSRKIRVLMVITVLGTGGATKVVLDLASHFNGHPDFDVQLLTGPIPSSREDLTYLPRQQGIPTREVASLINHISPITNLKAISDIRRIIVQGNYDIVHSHSSVAGVVARLAAFTAGVPVIVHHVHGWGLHEYMSGWTRMLYLTLERISSRVTDRMIVVSRSDIQKGLAHRICTKDKFALIYNGIELEKFRQAVNERQVRRELGLDLDCELVGMIGRLDRQKNPLDFIKSAALVSQNYSNVQFIFVGDGPLRDDCERLVDELNLKNRFVLLGFQNDVARILSVMSIVVMSSLWEGLPLVFLEAMSAGKPVIANDVDGAREAVVHGETGYLVTPHQPAEMADRILDLLNSETLCAEMGHTARQRSEYFSKPRMVEEIETLYKELLSRARHSA